MLADELDTYKGKGNKYVEDNIKYRSYIKEKKTRGIKE